MEPLERQQDAGNEDLTGDSAIEPSNRGEPTFREEKAASPKMLVPKTSKKLLPYEIDLASRFEMDFEPEELSDDELDFELDDQRNPTEVIFGELGQGSYFGSLALEQGCETKKQLKEARGGRCRCSVWATQNCHILYIRKDEYKKWFDKFT